MTLVKHRIIHPQCETAVHGTRLQLQYDVLPSPLNSAGIGDERAGGRPPVSCHPMHSIDVAILFYTVFLPHSLSLIKVNSVSRNADSSLPNDSSTCTLRKRYTEADYLEQRPWISPRHRYLIILLIRAFFKVLCIHTSSKLSPSSG